jgi:hypothetical protein
MSNIRQITPETTLDDLEDEIGFTRAAIKADPDAADLLPMTDDWLDLVDAVRVKSRQTRFAEVDANAARSVANYHLDRACTQFGDDLLLAVNKDRESARWTQFFSISTSQFIKIRFDKQIQKVKTWLSSNVNDPIVEKHRQALTTWSSASAASLDKTSNAAMLRANVRIAREQLAEDLTRERDGLFDTLSARARAKGLPRDWPKQFFRVTIRKPTESSNDLPENPSP